MRLPSSVLTINVANFAQSTSDRNSPRRCPCSAIDCRRSSQELRACRAFARNGGLLSSESMAVFSSGQPPGTSPARRSRKFRTTCLRRSTVFEISPVPSKRASNEIVSADLKGSHIGRFGMSQIAGRRWPYAQIHRPRERHAVMDSTFYPASADLVHELSSRAAPLEP